MLVGSIAGGAYGRIRFTNDIDIVVDLRPDQVEPLCAVFPRPQFYVSLPAARDAVARGGRFNVIEPATANKIDFMTARRDAWGRMQLTRRRKETILPGVIGFVAAPEDVILAKLWYYQEGESQKHVYDIVAMMQVSGDEIDRAYIDRWVPELGLSNEWRMIQDALA